MNMPLKKKFFYLTASVASIHCFIANVSLLYGQFQSLINNFTAAIAILHVIRREL